MQLAQFINRPLSKKNTQEYIDPSHFEKNNSDNDTVLASDRVHQLKRQIEDLDEELMGTNTINFEEIRNQIENEEE